MGRWLLVLAGAGATGAGAGACAITIGAGFGAGIGIGFAVAGSAGSDGIGLISAGAADGVSIGSSGTVAVARGFDTGAGAVVESVAATTLGTTIVRPSSSSRMTYPTLRVNSTTSRATPRRYWLPRISFTGDSVTASGALRHAYTVSSRSTTRRLGESMNSA